MTLLEPPPLIADESDPSLFCWIGLASEDHDKAEEAFRELHRRHAKELYHKVKAWIGSMSESRRRVLDDESLTSATLVKAFNEAGTFFDKSCGDQERGARQVKKWLFGMAQNLAFDELKSPRSQITLQLSAQEIDEETEEDDLAVPSISEARSQQVREALETLPDVDRDILHTCLAFRAFGDNADALPDDIRRDLLGRHGLAEATFRQRKSRALRKLQSILSTE